MPKFLRQVTTGKVFQFNESLAKRSDMEPIDDALGYEKFYGKPETTKETAPVQKGKK